MTDRLAESFALVRELEKVSRRTFVAGATLSALLVACKRKRRSAQPSSDESAAPSAEPVARAFDATQRSTIAAVSARVLPGSPGAVEAGVVEFIDRALASDFFTPIRPAVVATCQLLDEQCRARHRVAFSEAPAGEQDALLADLSAGRLPVEGLPQQGLFLVLHTLTLEGFLADPIHGSNLGQVGWKSIGFVPPHLTHDRDPGTEHE